MLLPKPPTKLGKRLTAVRCRRSSGWIAAVRTV